MERTRPRLFANAEPQYVRTFRGTLSKLTKINFEKLCIQLLNDDVLPKMEEKDMTPEKVQETRIADSKIMIEVVKVFMNQVKISFKADKSLKNESNETTKHGEDSVLLYANLATELKEKWSGRQGRVFFECLMIEIVKFFNQYYENPGTDNLDRNAMIRFVSYLCMNNKKPVPVLFALKICETFDRPIPSDVGLRVKFFTYLVSKFKENRIFMNTYEKKYHQFFKDVSEDKFPEIKDKALAFRCQDDILSRWN